MIAVISALPLASSAERVIALAEVRWRTLLFLVIVTPETLANAVFIDSAISAVLILFSVVVPPLTMTGATAV